MIAALNEALAGRYRVESLAGRGGMASVYRATDLRHGRQVAIKVMHADYAETVGRERFLREIRVTAALSHPHLLALYDSGEAGERLFYVMPFVEGMSLRDRLATEGPLPLADVRKIIRETAEALSFAHAHGVIHRDIKPENILLAGYVGPSSTEPRQRWNTLVADFGISAPIAKEQDHLTATGLAVGSPRYMSPEQAVAGPVDRRTDIWALGCIAYEMLEGAAPRGALSFSRADVAPSLAAAILRALNPDPALRFGDATELADAVDASASPGGSGRRRTGWWIAAAGVLLAAGAVAVKGSFSGGVTHPARHDSLAVVLYNRGKLDADSRNAARLARAFSDLSAAVARDSSFAPAWAGLAQAATFAHTRGDSIPGRSHDSLFALAVAASTRAIVLDSTLADAWLVRARVMEALDPTTRGPVISVIRRAIAIDSTNGSAWFQLARAKEELLDSAGSSADYARAVRLAPKNLELLAFYGFHGLWNSSPREGLRWADSAIALEPTYELAREAAAQLATQMRDWPAAERHVDALLRLAKGPDRVNALGHAAWLASRRGDISTARRLAREAEAVVDRAKLTKHEAAYLGEAFSAAGDTARAVEWLAAFSPRADMHYQLHLQRDPALAWLHDRRYSYLLTAGPR